VNAVGFLGIWPGCPQPRFICNNTQCCKLSPVVAKVSPMTSGFTSSLVEKFQIFGALRDAVPHGSGHINDTFAATFSVSGTRVRYIFQRINHPRSVSSSSTQTATKAPLAPSAKASPARCWKHRSTGCARRSKSSVFRRNSDRTRCRISPILRAGWFLEWRDDS
jgi:hypothetical protein